MIRQMTRDDLAAVKEVVLAVNKGVSYDVEQFLVLCLEQKPDLCMVAESGGEIVGVAIAGKLGMLGMIDLVAVSPDHQRSGIGNALMTDISRRCSKMGITRLAVLTWSAGVSFYEAFGFATDPDFVFMSRPIGVDATNGSE